jgi:hypothetical protein
MTKDEKQVLKGLLVLVSFKAVLFITLHQASKAAREAIKKYTTEPI